MDKIKKKIKQKNERKNVITSFILLIAAIAMISTIIFINSKINYYINETRMIDYEIKSKQDEIREMKNNINTLEKQNQKITEEINNLKLKVDSLKLQYEDNLIKLSTIQTENVPTKESQIKNKIIKNNDEYYYLISTLPYASMNYYSLNICYSASRDGKKPEDFLKKCGNYQPILFLIRTKQGNRFGGYTSNCINGKIGNVRDREAYVFNLDSKKMYNVIDPEFAITVTKNNFPSFGGNDITLHSDLDSNHHFSTFPDKYGGSNVSQGELTNYEEYFIVDELEVYVVDYS